MDYAPTAISQLLDHQLAFFTPGKFPSSACILKLYYFPYSVSISISFEGRCDSRETKCPSFAAKDIPSSS